MNRMFVHLVYSLICLNTVLINSVRVCREENIVEVLG